MKSFPFPLHRGLFVLLLVSGFSFWMISGAFSQEPTRIAQESLPLAPSATLFSYQGQLLNSNGMPITDDAMPISFKLFPVATGGSPCWTENHTGGNAVNVEGGRFHVLLGQLIAIPDSCLTTNAYLELIVDGETLSPRELLTSVAYAVESNTLKAGAITRGDLAVSGNLNLEGNDISDVSGVQGFGDNMYLENDEGNIRLVSARRLHFFIDSDNNATDDFLSLYSNTGGVTTPPIFKVNENGDTSITGDLNLGGNILSDVSEVQGFGDNMFFVNDEGNIRLISASRLHFFIDSDNNATDDFLSIYSNRAGVTAPPVFQVNEDGDTSLSGDLSVGGSCNLAAITEDQTVAWNTDEDECQTGSITSGAYIEANLQSREERISGGNPLFEQGDLLCWDAERQQLELCHTANDRLVMAVADRSGKPIVLGAEPIKVLGPVKAGDILVASSTPAMP